MANGPPASYLGEDDIINNDDAYHCAADQTTDG